MLSGTLAFESAASASSATPGLLANLTCHAASLKHLQTAWRPGKDISHYQWAARLCLQRLNRSPKWPN
jgi:hypothetical protein